MDLRIETGELDEALRQIEFEAPAGLTDYEKTRLAIELLKLSAIRSIGRDICERLDNVTSEV